MTSINLTIHNKGFLLEKVLDGIKKNSTGKYEIVCVLDGCSDDSELILDLFIQTNPQIEIIKLKRPNVFETKSNNYAASNSDYPYIIIVQDDMVITEKGWNEKLIKPILQFEDVFAVTARTAHDWKINDNAKDSLSDAPDRFQNRWCDLLNHCNHAGKDFNPQPDIFYMRQTVNRGPLAIRKDIFDMLGGFDEAFCPQDSDDHDLCYRAYSSYGLRSGAFPIGYLSENDWGGTRENGQTKSWMYAANQKNTRLLLSRHRDLIEGIELKNEERKIL